MEKNKCLLTELEFQVTNSSIFLSLIFLSNFRLGCGSVALRLRVFTLKFVHTAQREGEPSAARWYTPSVCSAVLFQSNFCACASQAAQSRFLMPWSGARMKSCFDIESMSSGSTIAAASPMISPNEPRVDEITGQPQAIASSGGRPKPS